MKKQTGFTDWPLISLGTIIILCVWVLILQYTEINVLEEKCNKVGGIFNNTVCIRADAVINLDKVK